MQLAIVGINFHRGMKTSGTKTVPLVFNTMNVGVLISCVENVTIAYSASKNIVEKG